MSLNGLVAFITGASSGLGKAALLNLVKKGARGVYCYDLQAFPQTDLDGHQDKILSRRGDVRDSKAVQAALDECRKKFGKIDTVINTAAVAIAFRLFNFRTEKPQKLEDFHTTLDINVVGTYNVCRLALPHLNANQPDPKTGLRGLIINTSGIAGFDGEVGQTTYAACAGAIDSLTNPLAREMALGKMRCVTISVGYFDTPVLATLPDWTRDYLTNYAAAPKMLGKPEYYANMVEHIITTPYLNMTTINLDAAMRPRITRMG